ncbi:hypothetical protein H5410_057686 [Solanum commersonii]|uniref:Disease resistance protein R3a-like protein n=1 Tax=Solanum commersonii TaxID=4109 RepID=A0A9J5WRB4_SOLCO|nr:hypothetical protein H5410_057686 [Solanum commersonii]
MEVGLAVGGAFLSSALNVLFDRLAPQGELLKMFQKRKNDVHLLKKLRMTLLGLQAVLSDAENKQASNQFVSQWLNEFRHAVDSAENLIEQVNYEALRLKVEGQHQNLAETSNQQVSDDFFFNIKDKLEETIETLEVLEKQIGRLGLKEYFGSIKQETRTPSTSLVDDSDNFGRQSEIEDLIDRLMSEDANGKKLTVVPIVGMGGVGKTTLAKAVYNDEKVKHHFGLKAWFCVFEAYDAFRITKGLLQEVGSFDLKDDDNLNQLQVKLKGSLNGKKFLVVLDDVWNDNYHEWDDLSNLFVQGHMGSKIIVTTRKESVALMMGSGAINVGTLSSEVSWDLFKRHSLENRDPKEHPELEEVRKKIADKCGGLPLALKALAGILRCKAEVDEWRNILRSEIWELPSCFNDQVIHLWIANGILPKLHSGNQYFLELISRSLFERVPKSKGKPDGFLMHDLVNDLAQVASSKLSIRLEENKGSHMLEQSRHMSYLMGYGDFEKLKPLYKLEQLRTLLPITNYHRNRLSNRVMHNILPRLTSLRALSLSHYEIFELPNDLFIKLKLLRFLDLSQTAIKRLPDSICALYNLETLLLSSCYCLEELPLQMERLINLRHLDISNTSRLKMLLHLSKLKNLQSRWFENGRFGEVQNLYGSLSVLELQNVVDRREAVKAKMREKIHVEKLSLEWSDSVADNSQTERDILDELHPHTNIKQLQIIGYRGAKFPNWLADPLFLKLVQLSLSNCKDCDSLPALGQLPSLKFLLIRGMHRITEVTEEFYGSSSSKKPFNSLEKLEFEGMPEKWRVPTLEKLSIENCPKLMGKLPENLCSLTELSISRCPELNLETPIQLSSLQIFGVFDSLLFYEAGLFTSQLEGMKQIVDLSVGDCNSLTSLPFSILPSTLKTIWIYHCRELKLELPVDEMSYCNMFLDDLTLEECDSISPELLPRARTLWAISFPNLTRFLIPTATEALSIWSCENHEKLSVAFPSAITYLHIDDCSKLKWLPEQMQELLPSLKELILENCPEIESFPEGGLPFNLQKLEILHCKKLVNAQKEWRLQKLPCLRDLVIKHDSSDKEIEHWEFPYSIRQLTIGNLKVSPLFNIYVLRSMLEQGRFSSFSHLTSLQSLHIRNFPNLQSLSESALPSSLSQLTIQHCPNLQAFSESALPSSLSELTIQHCRNLQLLSESALPSSLSELTIQDCPNLQLLPVKGMPSSLSKLYIYDCPLLKPLLEFDKGEYWPNIAQIPIIEIDQEFPPFTQYSVAAPVFAIRDSRGLKMDFRQYEQQ